MLLEPPEGLEERTRRRWQPGLGVASSSPIRQLSFPGSQLELGKDSRPDRSLLPGGREPIFPPAIMRFLPHLPRFITKRAQLFSQSVGLPIRGSRPGPHRPGDQSPLSPAAEAQPGRVELSLGRDSSTRRKGEAQGELERGSETQRQSGDVVYRPWARSIAAAAARSSGNF